MENKITCAECGNAGCLAHGSNWITEDTKWITCYGAFRKEEKDDAQRMGTIQHFEEENSQRD